MKGKDKMKFNKKKLQKAISNLEMKSNYVNSEYYQPKLERVRKLLDSIK